MIGIFDIMFIHNYLFCFLQQGWQQAYRLVNKDLIEKKISMPPSEFW